MSKAKNDVKAYKLGLYGSNSSHFHFLLNITKENSYINKNTNYDSLDEIIEKDKESIIEFDQVSGLLIRDLIEFDNINSNMLVFVFYDEIIDNSLTKHSVVKKVFYVPYTKYDLDKTIDDYIFKYFSNFTKCIDSDDLARRYNCFVERYNGETINNVYKKIDRK